MRTEAVHCEAMACTMMINACRKQALCSRTAAPPGRVRRGPRAQNEFAMCTLTPVAENTMRCTRDDSALRHSNLFASPTRSAGRFLGFTRALSTGGGCLHPICRPTPVRISQAIAAGIPKHLVCAAYLYKSRGLSC